MKEFLIMKKNASKLFKTFVAVSMSAVMLAGGSLSAAASAPDDDVIMPRGSAMYKGIIVTRGTSVTLGSGVEKSISNVDASVTLDSTVPIDDELSFYVAETNGTIVSSKSVKFRGTTSMEIGNIPYRSGKGVAGKKYCLVVKLSSSSKSNTLTVKCNFIP